MIETTIWLAHLSTALWVVGALGFLVFSVWLSVLDLLTRRLPNPIVLWGLISTLGPLAASSLMLLPVGDGGSARQSLWQMFAGAAALFMLFMALWQLSSAGIGGGDVKVAPIIGGTLGYFGGLWAVGLGVLLACAVAAIWGAAIRRRARHPRRAGSADAPGGVVAGSVPFATCLFVGAWIGILAGPLLMRIAA